MPGLRTNPVLHRLRCTLDAEGIPFTVGHRGKHPFIRFEIAGHSIRYPFPNSTGDCRSHLAASTQIRRIIRNMRENA